jgi:hypothetical protein
VFRHAEEEPSPQERLTGAGATHTAVEPGATEGPRGPREGLILLLFAVLTIAASAFVIWNEEQSVKDDPTLQPVSGLSENSLIREKNLERVLDKVAKSKWPLVRNIRIAPDNVAIQASDKDGFQRRLDFNAAIEMTDADDGVSEQNSFPAAKIDASAPERMLRGVTERSGLDADAVDYVTTSYLIDDDSTWFMAMKEGPARVRQWVAEPDGRDARHPGELSTADRQAQERQQHEFERSQRLIRRRSQCLSRATTGEQVTRCVEKFAP